MPKITLVFIFLLFSIDSFCQYNLDLKRLNDKGLPINWYTEQSLSSIRIDSTIINHGKYSVSIENHYDSIPFVSFKLQIPSIFLGKKIKLVGDIKTENVKGFAGFLLRVDGDGRILDINNPKENSLTGTTDWKEETIELNFNSDGADMITIGGVLVGSGKMWFDNVSLTIDGNTLDKVPLKPDALLPANKDTAFSAKSGIDSIVLTPEKVTDLANLGMVWGFLKYHHSSIRSGKFNMDTELFRILPKILKSKSHKRTNAIIAKWVKSFGLPDVCVNCRAYNRGKVKLFPDYGYLFKKGNLPSSLQEKLAFIRDNTAGGNDSYYVTIKDGIPIFTHERNYTIGVPDAGIRLLALYRYWNIIQYYYPYRYLLNDWDSVLVNSIPEFANTEKFINALPQRSEFDSKQRYQVALLKLISNIHDTHGKLWGNNVGSMIGNLMVPFQSKFIQDSLVVTDYYKDTLGVKQEIHIGDVIIGIDGESVQDLVKTYLPFTPGSNLQTQLRDLPKAGGLLLSNDKSRVSLQILRAGKVINANINRIPIEDYMYSMDLGDCSGPGLRLINQQVGYICASSLKDGNFENAKKMFSTTKGIIIDLRCYPLTYELPDLYVSWFKSRQSDYITFTEVKPNIPGLFEYGESHYNGYANGEHYNGKVVVLVNSQTQSQSEYDVMAIRNSPHATVIGQKTAGTDGNVAWINLPGNLRTRITSVGVYYPDGSETQRCGLRIDKIVTPTVEDINAGRDIMLEDAVKLITDTN